MQGLRQTGRIAPMGRRLCQWIVQGRLGDVPLSWILLRIWGCRPQLLDWPGASQSPPSGDRHPLAANRAGGVLEFGGQEEKVVPKCPQPIRPM